MRRERVVFLVEGLACFEVELVDGVLTLLLCLLGSVGDMGMLCVRLGMGLLKTRILLGFFDVLGVMGPANMALVQGPEAVRVRHIRLLLLRREAHLVEKTFASVPKMVRLTRAHVITFVMGASVHVEILSRSVEGVPGSQGAQRPPHVRVNHV